MCFFGHNLCVLGCLMTNFVFSVSLVCCFFLLRSVYVSLFQQILPQYSSSQAATPFFHLSHMSRLQPLPSSASVLSEQRRPVLLLAILQV